MNTGRDTRRLIFNSLLSTMLMSGAVQAQNIVMGWEQPEGMATFSLDLGDIDGDTDLDLYTADFESADALWLNDGSGNFSNSGQALDSGRGSKVHLDFIDNDAHLDLWLARHLSTIALWTNDGLGTLVDSGQSLGESAAQRGGVLGDLDGDGDLDAVQPTDSSSKPNRVLINDGTGVFTDSGQDLGMLFSRAAALADVDGDDDLDIMFGNNGRNKLWLNDGSANFTEFADIGLSGTFDVQFCDVDGDDDEDVFFVNGSNGGQANKVFLNDGNGNFTDSGQSLGLAYDFAAELVDVDGDNDCDAYVVGHVTWGDTLWLNDGNGNFTYSATFGEGGGIDVRAGDINGDGHVDMAVANRYQPDTIWLGDGAGNFTNSGQLLGSSAASEAALGDVDGDGDLDALTGNLGAVGRILLNDGTGNFTDSNQWLNADYGHNINALCLVDLDGDNDLDAFLGVGATGGGATNENRIWWNDGNGIFSDSGQRLGSSSTTAVVCRDVDGDNDVDLMVGNALTDNVLWRNDGNGIFTLDLQTFGTDLTYAIALEDLTGSGTLDMVITNLGTQDEIWFGNGTGSFINSGQLLGATELDSFSVDVGDLNGDNWPDLFVGNQGPNTVLFNDGTGIFTDSGQLLGSSATTTGVHLDDIDFDGDLDAWVVNSNSARNEVWLNDGNGTFTDSGLSLGTSFSNGSAIGNINGNVSGNKDLFVANFYGDHRVWLNQTLPPLPPPVLFGDDFDSGDTGAWTSSSP